LLTSLTTDQPLHPARRPGAVGCFATIGLALLLIVSLGVGSAPAASQHDDGTNPTCDVASPAASPEAAGSTPAADASSSDRIDRIVEDDAGSSPAAGATPTAPGCVDAPTGDELLATAAALLERATQEAGDQAGTPASSGEVASGDESAEITAALPAADIPSTNVQGFSFNLEASLTADLASVAVDAPIYRLEVPVHTAESVGALAAALGITGAVEDRGNATYAASGNGELFVTPSLIQYLSPNQPGEGELPDDASAVEIAREWLRTSTLIQPDLGEGKVVSRDNGAGRIVVVFTPVEPSKLLSAYPSITVSVGRGGTVLEVASRWASIQRTDQYLLRPSEDAWRQVETGQGYVEVELEGSGIQQGSVISGLVTYSAIELAYTTAGPPGSGQFLVPIFVFSGLLTPEGTNQTYPINTYVPALAISDTPVGFTGEISFR
jgi:hypothetical protein